MDGLRIEFMNTHREIKFRYWNSVTNQMVHNPKLPEKRNWTIEQLFSDRGWVWMQFTGLKDKNGNEIYERDVLTGGHEVYWGKGCYMTEVSNHTYTLAGIVASGGHEIIGNIYENPELLNTSTS